jgi:hypothetical protein
VGIKLDRADAGNALTGTLFKDVGITQDQLNNGQTILLLMIVVFEIPSNILLTRLGAKWWISSQSKSTHQFQGLIQSSLLALLPRLSA